MVIDHNKINFSLCLCALILTVQVEAGASSVSLALTGAVLGVCERDRDRIWPTRVEHESPRDVRRT